MAEKTRQLHVRLLDRHIEKLDALQERAGLGRSDIIRLLIDQTADIVIRPTAQGVPEAER